MTDNEMIEAVKEFSQDKTALVTTKGIITFGKIYEFISRLQADKEALIAGQETLQKALAEKIAEVNKLTYQVNRLKKYDEGRDIRLHAKLTATARAEAIKEFARELRQQAFDRLYVSIDEINMLEKEKVGE